nr:hypothetical protein [Tropicimonas marinistellae]
MARPAPPHHRGAGKARSLRPGPAGCRPPQRYDAGDRPPRCADGGGGPLPCADGGGGPHQGADGGGGPHRGADGGGGPHRGAVSIRELGLGQRAFPGPVRGFSRRSRPDARDVGSRHRQRAHSTAGRSAGLACLDLLGRAAGRLRCDGRPRRGNRIRLDR